MPIDHDGIYEPRQRGRKSSTTELQPPEEMARALELLAKNLSYDWLPELWRNIGSACLKLVRPHVKLSSGPSAGFDAALDFGDGYRGYLLDADAPERVFDAIAALKCLRVVCDPTSQTAIVQHDAYLLGRLVERLHVRPYEPLVTIGRGTRQRAIAAGKTRVLLTPEQQKTAAGDVTALVAKGVRLQAACKQLARKYGVHFSTLKRYSQREAQS